MNILVLCPHVPFPLTNGRSLILYNVFKRLSARHEIHLLSFQDGPVDANAETALRGIFREIHAIEPGLRSRSRARYARNILSWNTGFLMKEQYPALFEKIRARIQELVRLKRIDVVHFASLDSAEFADAAEGCGTVLHLVDSVTLEMRREFGMERSLMRRFRKMNKVLWYLRICRYEKRAMKRFGANITVGKKDFEVLSSLSPDANIVLIPNGVDTEYFSAGQNTVSSRPTVLFTGNMRFPPNMDAVSFFHDDVYPLIREQFPQVRFIIAGTSPPKHILNMSDGDGVVVTGFVDDIRTVMAQADVIVCPMRIGGGIKNKILEAMAFGKPVVSTSLGAEGVDARNGESIMIADSPKEIAGAVARLLKDRSLRDRVAERARRLVEERYTWETAAGKYEEVFEKVLRNRNTTA